MYGYRQSNENGLMTNLNSISSSLSSIDTVGRRNNGIKASADNLITTLRGQSNTSTSLLWNKNSTSNHIKDNDRYSTAASMRNGGSRYQGSEIYYNGGAKPMKNFCPTPYTALHFILVPLLLLTITRQVFDFLGQLWLQIIVNFFTIIIIIVALFGVRQNRISYLVIFILWSLLNMSWNLLVVCIHTKIRDVGLTEEFISLYTGTFSWWQSNGPGCAPYNISSIPPPVTLNHTNPQIITGCRLDYHLIEATQAALHASLSLLASLFCCCVATTIRRNPAHFIRKAPKSDKLFRLNNLTSDRSKINHNPFPNHHDNTRFGSGTASIRRAANKTSSRSSQHSLSSVRSRQRRNRLISEGVVPAPRGSTSSAHRSQKYGSLSSRRSQKNRRGDMSSLTYGTTGDRVASANQRARLSSLSSADYLPSYQPPHSSSANLLSSYGEISSIDSYNNDNPGGSKYKRGPRTNASQGNTNPTYNGSRSSVCSQNTNNNNVNNYHSLSYIYGNNSRASESLYGGTNGGASTSAAATARDQSRQRQHQLQKQHELNQNDRVDSVYGSRGQQQVPSSMPQEIQVETYHKTNHYASNGESAMTRAKVPLTNGGSFHSFSSANKQHRAKLIEQNEINNNNMISNYQNDAFDAGDQIISKKGTFDPHNNLNTFDKRQSRPSGLVANGNLSSTNNQSTIISNQQIYTNQTNFKRPIYSNQAQNGNSETPI